MMPIECLKQIIGDCKSIAQNRSTSEVTRNRLLKTINGYKKSFSDNDNQDIYEAIRDLYWETKDAIELQSKEKQTEYSDISKRLEQASQLIFEKTGYFYHPHGHRIIRKIKI